MNNTTEETAEAVRDGKKAGGAVQQAANAAMDAASHKAAQVADRVKDAGTRAVGYVQDQYEHLSEHAHDAYSHAKDKAYGWEQSVENYVKDRPLKSLLIAAGAGALLALLWRRRD